MVTASMETLPNTLIERTPHLLAYSEDKYRDCPAKPFREIAKMSEWTSELSHHQDTFEC